MRAVIAVLSLLFLLGASHALVVGPAIYEQKDFNGDQHQFTYSLSADCNASVITAIIYNESNKPVQDANVLLSYVDFSTPLLRNLYTDKDGVAILKLPGQVQLMRGLFILVIQKSGFRSKEVHFDLYPCFHNGSLPPKPAPPPKPPASIPNSTLPNQLPPPPVISAGPQPPPSSNGSNRTGQNGTGAPPASGGGGAICPAAFILPSLLFFKTPKR